MKALSLSKSSPRTPREEALGALDPFDHERRLAQDERETFRPAGGHAHHPQRLDEGSRNRCAAMRNQNPLRNNPAQVLPVIKRTETLCRTRRRFRALPASSSGG